MINSDKPARLYLDMVEGRVGKAFRRDATELLSRSQVASDPVDLLLTSPPYLDVVNYGTANWIRLWWLRVDEVSNHGGVGRRALNSTLDHLHNYESYQQFILRLLKLIRRVLKRDGVAVLVIGDVVSATRSYNLAQQVWTDIGSQTGLRLIDLIEDSLPAQTKVSRIWKETKGRATEDESILVLGREDGTSQPLTHDDVDWEEPYKDGGPDEAQVRVANRRVALRRAG